MQDVLHDDTRERQQKQHHGDGQKQMQTYARGKDALLSRQIVTALMERKKSLRGRGHRGIQKRQQHDDTGNDGEDAEIHHPQRAQQNARRHYLNADV
ncbi:hypothetical protein GCM10027021_20890 [Dyella kyungheensis]